MPNEGSFQEFATRDALAVVGACVIDQRGQQRCFEPPPDPGSRGIRVPKVQPARPPLGYGVSDEQIHVARIDNLVIEVDGPEVPILDGSALPYCRLIEAAGIRRQDALRKILVVTQPPRVDLDPPAPQAELEGLIGHLETLLEDSGYFYPPDRVPTTKLTLRNLLTKPGWTEQELRTLRGVLSAREGKTRARAGQT